MELFLRDPVSWEIKSYHLTDEQIEKQKLLYESSIDENWELTQIETTESIVEEKKKALIVEKTADEIITEDVNYFDTGVLWKELWDLLVAKLLGWNPHKENQYTRYILNLLIKVVLQWYTPVQEDLDMIAEVVALWNKTEQVLWKFRNPNA